MMENSNLSPSSILASGNQGSVVSGQELDQSVFLKNVERFEHGELKLLLDNPFLGSLPRFLSQLHAQSQSDRIHLFLDRFSECTTARDGRVRERAVMILSLFADVLKDRPETQPLFQRTCSLLIQWLRIETSNFSVVEKVLRQLGDNCRLMMAEERWQEVGEFLGVISGIQSGRMKKNDSVRSQATQVQERLADDAILELLTQAFLLEEGELRAVCEDLLIQLGRPAGMYLLKRLLVCQNSDHRFRLIGLIMASGHVIVPILSECLKKDPPWYVIRNIILIITALNDQSLLALVLPYLGHEDIRVQQQVIDCIQEIGGTRKHEYLRQALKIVKDELRIWLIMQLGQPGDQESVDSMLDLLAERDQFSPHVRDDMLIKLCNGLRFAPQSRAVNLLHQLIDERLQGGGEEEADLVVAAARHTLHILEPQLRHLSRQLPLDEEQVSFVGDVDALEKARLKLQDLDARIDRLVQHRQITQAVTLLGEQAIVAARKKDFVTAELLTDKMFKVDPKALDELIRISNIIEEEKSTSVTSHYIKTWLSLYNALGLEEFNALYSVLRHQHYHAGELIVRQGEIDSSLYFVNSGQVRLACHRGNRELFLKRLYPGEMVGLAPFFGVSVWTVTLTAITPVELQVLSREALSRICGDYPEIEAHLYGYCRENDRVPEWLQVSGEERRESPRHDVSIIIRNILLDDYEGETRYRFKSRLVELSEGGCSYLVRIADQGNARLLLGRKVRSVIPVGETDSVTVNGTIVGVIFQEYGQRDYSVHVKFNQLLSESKVMDIVRKKKRHYLTIPDK